MSNNNNNNNNNNPPAKNSFTNDFVFLTDEEIDDFDFTEELEKNRKAITKLLDSSDSSDVVEITKEEFENGSK